jgi:hypothetical protein
MFEDDDLYIDRAQLAARGWTLKLIKRYLPNPDRWASVDHWRNYTGKATYFVEKVIAAEQLADFKKAFSLSVARRQLSRKNLNAFMRERTRVDNLYRDWIKTVSPKDVKTMIVTDELVAFFEAARARGYRTPHK